MRWKNSSQLRMNTELPDNHFDYLVIGGGSGGVASARRAAGYGVKVGLIESARLGGTCVNVGCVPKKVMFNAATVAEVLHDAEHFGFEVKDVKFNWKKLKDSRDAYVKRLNGIYSKLLANSNVTVISGTAAFTSSKTVKVNDKEYSAKNILVAVGGKPSLPSEAELKGVQHCISSDGFFELESLPRSVAVVGAGYIGVELAGVLHGLGAETHIFNRAAKPLSARFDALVVDTLLEEMQRQGLKHHANQSPVEVAKSPVDGRLTIKTATGEVFGPFDQVITSGRYMR